MGKIDWQKVRLDSFPAADQRISVPLADERSAECLIILIADHTVLGCGVNRKQRCKG